MRSDKNWTVRKNPMIPPIPLTPKTDASSVFAMVVSLGLKSNKLILENEFALNYVGHIHITRLPPCKYRSPSISRKQEEITPSSICLQPTVKVTSIYIYMPFI